MAGNIAGMFKMINNAVQTNPLAPGQSQGDGGGLLGMASQNLGNLAAQGVNAMAPEGAPQAQGMDFMNDWAKAREEDEMAKQAMSEAFTSKNPDTMEAAAQKLLAMGKNEEAEKLMARAKNIREQQQASLEAMGEQNKVEAEENKKKWETTKTINMAKRKGDMEAAQLMASGALKPEVYAAKLVEEKDLYELSKGEMLTDKDGNIIRLNPDTGEARTTKHAADKKEWDRLTTEALTQSSAAAQAARLSQDIAAVKDWKTGAYSDFYGWYAEKTGQRGNEEYLKTQFDSIRVADGINKLPKGPASDKDIELVMGTVPGKNASQEEIIRYLQAVERTNKRLAEYNQMRKDYVIRNDRESFDQAWETHKGKVEVREWRKAAAENGNMAAAQQVNPQTGKTAEQLVKEGLVSYEDFFNTYKYRPDFGGE